LSGARALSENQLEGILLTGGNDEPYDDGMKRVEGVADKQGGMGMGGMGMMNPMMMVKIVVPLSHVPLSTDRRVEWG